MRKLIKFILFFPLVALIISLSFAYCEGRGRNSESSVFSCLVAGYDEAAENTDVLFIMSYDKEKDEVTFVQIPRDSFTEYRGKYGKVNRIFSSERARGKSGDDALSELSLAIEEYLGVKIDASVALSLNALLRFIDNFGGVSLNVPESVALEKLPIKLSYGENVVSAADALKLVRGRSGYASGDLGRLDAQKIFLEGLFHTVFNKLDAKRLVKLIFSRDSEVFVKAPVVEASGLLMREFGDLKKAKITLLTLPGEACEYGGVSYYVVNRRAASAAIANYISGGTDNFDKEYKLTDGNNPTINGIYMKDSLSYKIYSDGITKDINVN